MTTRKIEAGRLADTAVTPGSYGNSSAVPVITVDQQGRLTSASATTVDGVSNFTYTSANNTFTIATPAGSSYTASISAVEDMIVNGNTVLGSGATDVVQFNATVNSHIIPAANITYDLGSSTNRFRDLYLSGSSIYLGGHTISANATHIDIGSAGIATTGTTTGDADLGELTVSGNAAVTGTITGAAATITGTVSAANLYSSANATVVGTLTTADAVISGNLTVSGTTTYVNTSTLNIGDNIITLNADETGTPSQNAGFEVERGTSTNVSFVWDETNDRFTIGSEDLFLDDNAKAIFGAGSDLQIYHDSLASYVQDVGTGPLYLQGNGGVVIRNSDGSQTMGNFTAGGNVDLYHNNVKKFNTTSTGVDVTGTMTADGLTVDGNATIQNTGTPTLTLSDSDGTNQYLRFRHNGNESYIDSRNNTGHGNLFLGRTDGTSNLPAIKIGSGGDVSLYADDGTTQGFFWDASTQRLGLGTTSPAHLLHLSASDPRIRITDTDTAGSFELRNTSNVAYISNLANAAMLFATNSLERMRITSSGNVGIGTPSPGENLSIAGAANIYASLTSTGGIKAQINAADATGAGAIGTVTNHPLRIETNNTERMRIMAGGNVGIGTTSPTEKLTVDGGDLLIKGTIPEIKMYSPDGSSNQYFIGANISDAVDGGLRFGSGPSISGGTSHLTITSAGVVGIGTSSPANQLHVASSSYTIMRLERNVTGGGAGLRMQNGDGNYWQPAIGGDEKFYFDYNGSNKAAFDSSGNFGIGTTSPAAQLHISGSGQQQLTLGSTNASRAILVLDGDSNGDGAGGDYAYLAHETNGDFSIVNLKSGTIDFKGVGAATKMRLNSNGNLGIGDTNPGAKLKVNGPSGIVQLSGGSTGSSLIYGNAASGHTGELLQIIDKNGTQQVHVSNGGDVGIGTSSPTKKLEVNGAVVAATQTTTKSGTPAPNFDNYQNFVWTLTGNITLLNPTTEKTGQTGFFIFIHSGAGRTVSLGTDYETAGGAGLTLSTTSGAADIVPYAVLSTGRILFGTPQLAFA